MKVLLLTCLALAMMQAQAQGWMKKYSPDAVMAINTIYPTPGGGYLVTGWNINSSNTGPGQRIIKVDANGLTLWRSDIDSIEGPTVSNITQDGGLVIFGSGPSQYGSGQTHSNLVKTDRNGHKLWLRTLHPERPLMSGNSNADIDTTDDGGLICTYTAMDTAAGSTLHVYVTRLDADGHIVWEHPYYTSDTMPVSYSIRNTGDGGYVVTAAGNSTTGTHTFKLDRNGNILWNYAPNIYRFVTTYISRDGNIILLGSPYGPGPSSITKLNQAGTVLWTQNYNLPDTGGWFAMSERGDGRFTVMGSMTSATSKFSLSIADSTGALWLYKGITVNNLGPDLLLYSTGYRSYCSLADNSVIIGGWVYNDPHGYSGFLIKMDSMGNSYPAVLSGHAYLDANSNCVQDAGEQWLSPVYLTLSGATDTFAAVAHGDSAYYSVPLDTGHYTIALDMPSPYWVSTPCNVTSIDLPAGVDSSVSFGLTPIASGPYVVINGHQSRQVLCRPAVYTAQYCNTGTAPFGGRVEITVDTILHIDSASSPWASQSGNLYTFNVDTLGVMECGTIALYYTVPCGGDYLRRTACIDAQAKEDTIINPSSLWDGSNLRMAVDYSTATDSITFTVSNSGTGTMGGPKGMIVIEDNVILVRIPVQLPAGGIFATRVKANGATWRATVPQTEHNPYSKFATAAIEAAGTNTGGGVSLGFITQYPYNGYTSYEYNSCAEVYGSYDPNDKEASPKGAGPDHLIEADTRLEYTINFQNTGTDTAYTVVVTDTLAANLNPATLRLEMSSHPCVMSLSGKNLVTFTFDHILLPDSGANQLLSNGFVKFRIDQKAGNPIGAVINNKAGIYFDYNAPVITNTVTLRIGEVLVTGIRSVYADKALQIAAYPNPFVTTTTISVAGESFDDMQLDIYDNNGRLVRRQLAAHSDYFILDHAGLNPGNYIFQLTGNGKPVGSGKIAAQ